MPRAAVTAAETAARSRWALRLPNRRALVLRIVMLLVAGGLCLAVSPQIVAVFSALPRLRGFNAVWFPAMVALEAGSFVCVWHLLRITMPGVSWSLAASSHLTSNAVSRLCPGGGALGNACHFRMLTVAGLDPAKAGSAITAVALISGGFVFALPVFALPAMALGGVPGRLSTAVLAGGVVFLLLTVVSVVLARSDRVVHAVGRFACTLLRRVGRPQPGLPALLLVRRDEVRAALSSRWRGVALAAFGRSGLDFLALVAALYGTGQHPSPALILLAYVAATVLTMIPITPGGLGFVEAGLVGTLVIAGVPAAPAALATLAYRLVSFWLPVPAGLPAWIAFRRRHGTLARAATRATHAVRAHVPPARALSGPTTGPAGPRP